MEIGGRLRRSWAAQPAGGERPDPGPRASAGAATLLASAEFARVGVQAQLLRDDALSFLLVSSRIEPAQSMLLVTGPDLPPRGLSAFSRMGRWHALYWALVWGWGPPPPEKVAFTSTDLRFRAGARASAEPLGPAWLTVCEGVFTVATVTASSGGTAVLDLAPQW
jgi:hypothetical protein